MSSLTNSEIIGHEVHCNTAYGTPVCVGVACTDYTSGSPCSRRTFENCLVTDGVHAHHDLDTTSGASVTEVLCVGGAAAGEDSGAALDYAVDLSLSYGTSGRVAERPE